MEVTALTNLSPSKEPVLACFRSATLRWQMLFTVDPGRKMALPRRKVVPTCLQELACNPSLGFTKYTNGTFSIQLFSMPVHLDFHCTSLSWKLKIFEFMCCQVLLQIKPFCSLDRNQFDLCFSLRLESIILL